MYQSEIKYLRTRYGVPEPENAEVKAVLKNKGQTYEQLLLECAGDDKTWDEMIFERLDSVYRDLTVTLYNKNQKIAEAKEKLDAVWAKVEDGNIDPCLAVSIGDYSRTIQTLSKDIVDINIRRVSVYEEMVDRKYIERRS